MKFHVPTDYDADRGDEMAQNLMKKIVGLINSEMADHAATGATPEEVIAVAYDAAIRVVGQMLVNYAGHDYAIRETSSVKDHLKLYVKGIINVKRNTQ